MLKMYVKNENKKNEIKEKESTRIKT